MGLVMAGLAIGGAAVSAIGKVKAGNAAKRAGEAQGQIEDYNASVATTQAQDAVERGAVEESRFRSSVRGIVGTQRAHQAAGNVDVGFGSAVDVQADAAQLGENDALTIRTNAARAAWGYKVEAFNHRMNADVARKTGKAAATASRFGAVSDVIGIGTSLAMMKYGGKGGQ